jgi:three-Cys-motif partner protein
MKSLRLDEIGFWSEIKLEIIGKYARAYSTIMSAGKARAGRLSHIYIDAFAGAGRHLSKQTGAVVFGSPTIALSIDPPFHEFHFIDLDSAKIQSLRDLAASREDVWLYEEDCNTVLIKDVFPRAHFSDRRRALCLLDPYGLDLSWDVVLTAGQINSIEVFLNFPIMDINRNVLRRDPNEMDQRQMERMDYFWGDRSWYEAAYDRPPDFFGGYEEKKTNRDLVKAYQKRLKEVAGFKFVPEPLPMNNSIGRTVYYLIFASPNDTGRKIVREIFTRYKNKGLV